MSRPSLADNNLDLVRFALATTVFFVHCHVLSTEPSLAVLSAVLSSDLAVKAFFVVSGLLVTMSFERSSSLADYAERRLRRIYPAYATVVLGAAVGLAAVTTVSLADYFSTTWWRYLAANLAFANFLQPTLPGVFERNVVDDVNGALWTLKIEVMFYAVVPVLVALVRRWSPWPVLTVVYLASALYAWSLETLAQTTGHNLYAVLARQLPGQMMFFACGAAIYYGFAALAGRAVPIAIAGLLLFALDRMGGLTVLEPLWVGALVFVAGFGMQIGGVGRRGDLSYGIYVLHFPLVQILVGLGAFRASPFGGVLLATALVLVAALFMWRLVERPFLRRSSYYRA